MFKQNEHSLGCSSWIVAIQSLSGDSRRSAWRTCQHQPLTDPNTSCTTCVIMTIMLKHPIRVLAVDELADETEAVVKDLCFIGAVSSADGLTGTGAVRWLRASAAA